MASTSDMAFLVFTVLFLAVQTVHGDDNEVPTLKKHVAFFDRNHDGVISMWESIRGFRALGFSTFKSAASAFIIHVSISRKTRPGKGFSPRFPIVVENIKLAKRTGDSGFYDNEGRFVPEKLEEVFVKHARTNDSALTLSEVKGYLNETRDPLDKRGWNAARLKWSQLFFIGRDAYNMLPKETARKAFDGTLFYEIQNRRSQRN